ncbi:MAG: hypothetical protein OCD01_03960 [Fibrobacterales bacterium]
MNKSNSIFSFVIFILTLMISIFTAFGTAGMIRLEVANYHHYYWFLVALFGGGVIYSYALNDLKPLTCVAILNIPMVLLMIGVLFIDIGGYDKSLIFVPFFVSLSAQLFVVRRIDGYLR